MDDYSGIIKLLSTLTTSDSIEWSRPYDLRYGVINTRINDLDVELIYDPSHIVLIYSDGYDQYGRIEEPRSGLKSSLDGILEKALLSLIKDR